MLTLREIKKTLNNLSGWELDHDCIVSIGCDENGNAEFHGVTELMFADNPIIAAGADGKVDDCQLVMLFEE
jgi:hypothetical protein